MEVMDTVDAVDAVDTFFTICGGGCVFLLLGVVVLLVAVGRFELQPDSSQLHALPVRLPFPTFSASPHPSCWAIAPHRHKLS